MLRKILIVLLFCFALLIGFSSNALAQAEFSTDYQIKYSVYSNGTTHAKFDISLINKLSNVYAKEFALTIGSTDLSDIKVYDQKQDLEPNIVVGNKSTNIIIPFKSKALGKDKSQDFYLEFDTKDFAHQLGNVSEISIPKIQKTESLNKYNLILNVPNSLGEPATIIPTPTSKQNLGLTTNYRFSEDDLLDKGISATFGTIQYFDFSLDYHLSNPNVYKVETEIALPPDTTHQTVIYQSLDPKPDSIDVDLDGNWLAKYYLNPKQTMTIKATGTAEIYLHPSENFPGFVLEDPSLYLSAKPYWEIDNPRIQKLSNQFKSAKEIYQYVVDNLIYDYGRLTNTTTRFGAANALDNQDSAICMEFTDLFVALSRAAGIPARAINGYAYTTNSNLRPLSLEKDVLHAWPEYYDQSKKLWIPVDPTWGNTTGGIDFFNSTDLNHFTFAILGLDSEYPIPAGAYKEINQTSKDVQIDFGESVEKQESASLSFNLPASAISGMPVKGQVLVKNTGNIALYNQKIELNSEHFDLEESNFNLAIIPPFSTKTIDFTLNATDWHDNLVDNLTAKLAETSTSHQITLKPAYYFAFQNNFYLYIFIVIISLILVFIVLKLINEKLSKTKFS